MNTIQTKSRGRQFFEWLDSIVTAIDYDPKVGQVNFGHKLSCGLTSLLQAPRALA